MLDGSPGSLFMQSTSPFLEDSRSSYVLLWFHVGLSLPEPQECSRGMDFWPMVQVFWAIVFPTFKVRPRPITRKFGAARHRKGVGYKPGGPATPVCKLPPLCRAVER